MLFHLQGDKVLLHQDGRHSAEFPQYVVVGPVQQDVQEPRPYLTPCRQGARCAIAEAAQSPWPMYERRDHVGVSLTHLWTKQNKFSLSAAQNIAFSQMFCYLVDDFGLKGGNDAGVVKGRELPVHVMKR